MNKYNREIRERARELRKNNYSYGEIERILNMQLPKSTLSYWFRDLGILPNRKSTLAKESQLKGAEAVSRKYREIRNAIYNSAYGDAGKTLQDKRIRDFAIIYLCEGFRKTLHHIHVANSSPSIIKFCHSIFLEYADHKISYYLQYHTNQDLTKLKEFWSTLLNVDTSSIKARLKSNSGNLRGRVFNCEYGVLSIRTSSVKLRTIIQAWMDYISKEWEGQL